MDRPVGITILGILMIFGGLALAGAAVMFYFVGSTGAIIASRTNNGTATLMAGIGGVAGIICLFFGALQVVLAIGIFQLRNIARVLTIFLSLLIGASAVFGLIATALRYSGVGLAWNLSLLVADAVMLWYLLRPRVKEAFQQASSVQEIRDGRGPVYGSRIRD